MARRIAEPTIPMRTVISDFHKQTLLQLRTNFATQKIFPYEVYPHYREINKIRKQRGEWYSTGQGIESIDGDVVRADDEGYVTLQYTFNDYLRYVDIGVGQGTKAGDVERNKKVRYKSRYVSQWDRATGRSHRPGIMPELRHLQTRIRDYLVDFYGYQGVMEILDTFDGLNIDILNGERAADGAREKNYGF